jgi:guanylate kinase
MGKIISVLGKSSVGKDYLLNLMVDKGYKRVVSFCSRPIRSNEVNHRDYHFVTKETMIQMINNDEFVETRTYNVVGGETWYYGISKSEIDLSSDNNYISVVDGQGFKELREFYGKDNVYGVYLWVNNRERLLRALNRCEVNDNGVLEIIRRFQDDDIKFTKEVIDSCILKINNIDINSTLDIVLRNMKGE